MGCTCSQQDVETEKNNEMEKKDDKVEINENILLEQNINENENFSEVNKLKGTPPQAIYETKEKFISTNQENENNEVNKNKD